MSRQRVFIKCRCARRLSGGRGREPPDPWLPGPLHASSFFLRLDLCWAMKLQIFFFFFQKPTLATNLRCSLRAD